MKTAESIPTRTALSDSFAPKRRPEKKRPSKVTTEATATTEEATTVRRGRASLLARSTRAGAALPTCPSRCCLPCIFAVIFLAYLPFVSRDLSSIAWGPWAAAYDYYGGGMPLVWPVSSALPPPFSPPPFPFTLARLRPLAAPAPRYDDRYGAPRDGYDEFGRRVRDRDDDRRPRDDYDDRRPRSPHAPRDDRSPRAPRDDRSPRAPRDDRSPPR